MSAQWGNSDRAERIARRNRAVIESGRCSHCPPHRGENQFGHDGRFVPGNGRAVFVPSKGKDRK